MKRLLYFFGLVDLVWTEDMDYDRRLRIVWTGADNNRYVFPIIGRFTGGPPLLMGPDGQILTSSYVKKWLPYSKSLSLSPWRSK